MNSHYHLLAKYQTLFTVLGIIIRHTTYEQRDYITLTSEPVKGKTFYTQFVSTVHYKHGMILVTE
jgi:hypothetical protein